MRLTLPFGHSYEKLILWPGTIKIEISEVLDVLTSLPWTGKTQQRWHFKVGIAHYCGSPPNNHFQHFQHCSKEFIHEIVPCLEHRLIILTFSDTFVSTR